MSAADMEAPCLCGSSKKYKECCASPEKRKRMKMHSSKSEVEGEELNIAKALENIAKDLLIIADTETDYRNVVSMALGAWNITLIREPKLRKKAMEVQIKGLMSALVNPPWDYHIHMACILHVLVENKLRLYPNVYCHIHGLGMFNWDNGDMDIHVEFDPIFDEKLWGRMINKFMMDRAFLDNTQGSVS